MTAVEGMLKPLLSAATADATGAAQQLQARKTFDRLVQHLECNQQYYIQQFVRYLADKTNNQAIVDLANSVIPTALASLPSDALK